VKPPPLSLYVHLPWCVRKCPYCDFNSHTAGADAPRQRYLDALLMDLDREAPSAAGRCLETVFLGGGTPSLFSPQEIGRLLQGIRSRFEVAADVEVTMEANPGTVECGAPAGYREAGVTRLSIGAQSLNDTSLQKLGRIHSRDDVIRVAGEAGAAGFESFNIDLMHGLPGQGVQEALDDLRAVIELEPPHISWYQLTIEPNTVFFARPPTDLPEEDTAYEIQDEGSGLLAAAGYRQYEVSAFALDDQPCRHNLNYWLFGDYLAAGAGAHGKLTTADGIYRYQKPANPQQYMLTMERGEDGVTMSPVTGQERLFEFMLNALRLREGFEQDLFVSRTGLGASELEDAMRPASDRGLVVRESSTRWQPTALGRRFLNDLQASFLPASR
jgi:putative oxygen-independent coproporphyrinogen III oxidase